MTGSNKRRQERDVQVDNSGSRPTITIAPAPAEQDRQTKAAAASQSNATTSDKLDAVLANQAYIIEMLEQQLG